MSILNTQKTYKNLKSKGFQDSPSHSDDHLYIELIHEGKVILYTKLSHSGKDIGVALISKMAKQCKISKSQFIDLSKCPLSQEEYLEILRQKGEIE